MEPKRIGILGIGKYGQWLRRFFEEQGYEVIMASRSTELTPEELIEQADVIVVVVSLSATVPLLQRLIAKARPEQLWVSLASIMSDPVQVLLESSAEVASVHPMFAPPPGLTWKGRSVLVHKARVEQWKSWLDQQLERTEGNLKDIAPKDHDKMVAFVQGVTHAGHLARASVMQSLGLTVDDVTSIASSTYLVDHIVTGRILSNGAELSASILSLNPEIVPVLDDLIAQLEHVKELAREGRQMELTEHISKLAEYYGPDVVKEADRQFEEINTLLAEKR